MAWQGSQVESHIASEGQMMYSNVFQCLFLEPETSDKSATQKWPFPCRGCFQQPLELPGLQHTRATRGTAD